LQFAGKAEIAPAGGANLVTQQGVTLTNAVPALQNVGVYLQQVLSNSAVKPSSRNTGRPLKTGVGRTVESLDVASSEIDLDQVSGAGVDPSVGHAVKLHDDGVLILDPPVVTAAVGIFFASSHITSKVMKELVKPRSIRRLLARNALEAQLAVAVSRVLQLRSRSHLKRRLLSATAQMLIARSRVLRIHSQLLSNLLLPSPLSHLILVCQRFLNQ